VRKHLTEAILRSKDLFWLLLQRAEAMIAWSLRTGAEDGSRSLWWRRSVHLKSKQSGSREKELQEGVRVS
jgi:hypothetical protein